jgi:hypothetical protein
MAQDASRPCAGVVDLAALQRHGTAAQVSVVAVQGNDD